MKKLLISLTAVFLIINLGYAAKLATVNANDVVLTAHKNSEKAVGYLYTGMLVNIERKDSDKALVSFGKIRGWIQLSALTVYNEKFSNIKENIVLSDKIYKQDGFYYLTYYFKNKLHKFNIDSRSVATSQKTDSIASIVPSKNPDIFIIKGVYDKNGKQIENYSVFDFATGESIFVASFDTKMIKVNSIEFSDSSDYFYIKYSAKNNQGVAIYSTKTAKLIAHSKSVLTAQWWKDAIIFNNKSYFWARNMNKVQSAENISYTSNSQMLKVKSEWIINSAIDSIVDGNVLYILGKNGVIAYNIISHNISKTPFKSLTITPNKTYNFYIKGGRRYLYNVNKQYNVKSFSGLKPKYRFVQFVGNKILYRKPVEKIDTLFLLTPGVDDPYKFSVIEDIEAVSEDGIIAETIKEKDLIFLMIEDANEKQFYLMPLKK